MQKLLLAILALALTGCTSAPATTSQSSSTAQPEKAYRTGSNIPVR